MKKSKGDSPQYFWSMAHEFIQHELPDVRLKSPNTIKAYRESLNQFVDFLESKKIKRVAISFSDFSRANIREFITLLKKTKTPKTVNLRLTAIHTLLKFASDDSTDITPIYVEARKVKGVSEQKKPIEYFSTKQIKALLAAPSSESRTDRRNKVILCFMYDTACRIDEIAHVRKTDLHLGAEHPYVTLLGKGNKYRNIPLMNKTCGHLQKYVKDFHENLSPETPLFYSIIHGHINQLSSDTYEAMIQKYSEICEDNGVSMPENVHCHMIRKTRAMDLYQRGVSLSHIKELLGHESVTTTSGFYAFATLDTLAKTLNKAAEKDDNENWLDEMTISKIITKL